MPSNKKSKFNAFLTAGIGAGSYTGKFGAYAPTGIGLMANINGRLTDAPGSITLDTDQRRSGVLFGPIPG